MECFEIIGKCFHERKIEIKSKYLNFNNNINNNNQDFRGFNVSVNGEHLVIDDIDKLASFVEPNIEVIKDKRFLNYDPVKQCLVEVNEFRGRFTDWTLGYVIVCMFCEESIPKACVIKHLEECFGLEFENNDQLPAYKVELEPDSESD